MRKRDRETLHRKLLEQRHLLLKEVADTEADLETLDTSRESELEEAAQDERLRRLLDRLDRRAKAEVEEIDAALGRLAADRYGICVECEKPIALPRLMALPATPSCVECAAATEQGRRVPAEREESTEPPRGASLPPDYAFLTDRELQDSVREHLAADGRLDLDELRIVCRHGVVYLDGEVPSNTERQILLHTVTDVMGLTEVVDRLRVRQEPWQREERSPASAAPEPRAPWEEPPTTEDVSEASEEGSDLEAPDRPTPDEE